MRNKRIRVKSLAWIEDQGMLFVVKMFDNVKGDAYYRPIGGTVEFGERAIDTVKREVGEEIQTQIEVIDPPLILENIFTCNGEPWHEIDYLFKSKFVDKEFYERKFYRLVEANGDVADAFWIPMEDCLNYKLRLVPEEFLEWIRSH